MGIPSDRKFLALKIVPNGPAPIEPFLYLEQAKEDLDTPTLLVIQPTFRYQATTTRCMTNIAQLNPLPFVWN